MSSRVTPSDDGAALGRPAGPVGQIIATAIQTVRQTRGPTLWTVVGLGSVLAVAGGAVLTGAGGGGDLKALLFHGALCLLLTVAALAAGARALAGDRASGRRDLLGAQPIFAPAFFLGRFAGLALRFGLAAVVLAALGGVVLSLTGGQRAFLRVTEPSRLAVGARTCDEDDIVRLTPGGPAARWTFEGAERAESRDGALRFSFRLRHPKSKPLQNTVPLRVTVRSNEEIVVERQLTVSLRREFTLPLDPIGGRDLDVSCAVTGGHNFMEIGLTGCSLVRGASGPIVALLVAALSFLPLLWSILALCLLFSAFVQETTAFFAGGVLLLVTLAGPTLQKDLTLIAAGIPGGGHSHAASHDDGGDHGQPASPVVGFLARAAGGVLSLLPETDGVGAAEALSRGECPSAGGLAASWIEALPYLGLVLLLGCAAFSWRGP